MIKSTQKKNLVFIRNLSWIAGIHVYTAEWSYYYCAFLSTIYLIDKHQYLTQTEMEFVDGPLIVRIKFGVSE